MEFEFKQNSNSISVFEETSKWNRVKIMIEWMSSLISSIHSTVNKIFLSCLTMRLDKQRWEIWKATLKHGKMVPKVHYLYADFRASIRFVRSFCIQKTLCPEFCASKITYNQTFFAFQAKIRALKIWKFVRKFPDCCAFKNIHVQTFVRTKTFVHFSCFQKCVCPDFSAFMSKPIASFIKVSGT